MRPSRLRNARRPMSTESLARSATETRIMKALIPCGAARFSRTIHKIAKGRERSNMPGPERLSLAGEPGGIESVEPAPARIGVGQLQRQRAQVAVGGEELGAAADFLRCNRHAGDARIARQQSRDLLLGFLRLERADAIDQACRRA